MIRMWVVGQTTTGCVFHKIHVLVEQEIIIRDSNDKGTKLGIQRSQWVLSSHLISMCVTPAMCQERC